MSADGELNKAADSLRYLLELLDGNPTTAIGDFDRLLRAYIEVRGELSRRFRTATEEVLTPNPLRLQSARRELQAYMDEKYGPHLPPKYVKVRSFSSFHAFAYELLALRHPNPVPVSVLRVLSGDQVHTERRVRELRDLGVDVEWHKSSGEYLYMLSNCEPDYSRGAALQVRARVSEDKSLSDKQRASILAQVAALDS